MGYLHELIDYIACPYICFLMDADQENILFTNIPRRISMLYQF